MRTPEKRGVNPLTGKRYQWEAEKAAAAAIDPETKQIQKQIALLKRQQKALEASTRFMPFIKFTSPHPEDPNDVERSKYENARHHDAVALVIEKVVEGEIPFLILEMPPRHGKSEQVSRRLPAWYIGRFPHENIVVGTYNDDFAADFGKDVRNIMATSQYKQVFPDVKLQRGGAASDRLQTTKGGQLSFVGRGGSLTGRGAHLLILDDLIKDDTEAQSKAIRDKAWNWFTKVAMSRRMGRKLVIMTFTRWHADDPIGRLTNPDNPHYNEKLARRIKIIKLPAIAGEDDPLGRKPGEALWPDGPDKFNLEFLEEQRSLDPLGFSALYQQEPSLADGDLFERDNIKTYKPSELPEHLSIYCASDHAVGTSQRNDPSCFIKIGVDKNDDIYILDVIWKKMKSDVAVEAMLTMGSGNMRPIVWWAERGHISKAIGPFLYKRMQETRQYINIKEITPVQDKVQRAQSIAARIAMGKVKFPENELWTEKAVNELMAFPNGTHDDFVDALAYIGLGLQYQFGARQSAANDQTSKEPKFGSLAWAKLQETYANEKARANRAGGF